MERYLPRNLLVILISCRSVQPFLDSAWCAAAGGWWLTWKRPGAQMNRQEGGENLDGAHPQQEMNTGASRAEVLKERKAVWADGVWNSCKC